MAKIVIEVSDGVTKGDIIQNVCSMWIVYHDTDVEVTISKEEWNAPYNPHKAGDRLIDIKVWEEIKDEITRKARSGQWSEAVIFGMMRAYDIMCKHLEKQEETDGKISNDN